MAPCAAKYMIMYYNLYAREEGILKVQLKLYKELFYENNREEKISNTYLNFVNSLSQELCTTNTNCIDMV